MSIHVHRSVETGWTKLANVVLRDPDLSLRAKGLLVQLLSHEDGFAMSLKYAERQCRDGRDAIASAFHELEAAGYATKNPVRTDGGRFRGWEYHVYDCHVGATPELSGFTESGKAESGKAESGEGNPLVRLEELEEEQEQKNPDQEHIAPKHESQSTASWFSFDDFWTVYPRRAGKRAAETAWDKAVNREHPRTILLGARRYADDPNRDPAYTPHPATWLNQDRWDDDPLPSRDTAPRTKAGQRMDGIRQLRDRQREVERAGVGSVGSHAAAAGELPGH